MQQFLADQIDQLDLALDQLAVHDRNFDRFALMLIDNVVELVLHQHARDKQDPVWSLFGESDFDTRHLSNALGPHFDAKVKFAIDCGLVSKRVGESIQRLHGFRNSAYHQGLRHEGILHALSLFYFENCCELLQAYTPSSWSWSFNDTISFRARKYLGTDEDAPPFPGYTKTAFSSAFKRLKTVSRSLGRTLVADLAADMAETIAQADGDLEFLRKHEPTRSRDQLIVDVQVSRISFSPQGEEFARSKGFDPDTGSLSDWIRGHYPLQCRNDPIAKWRKRHAALAQEKDEHRALEKYRMFIASTAEVREALDLYRAGLEEYLEHMHDLQRDR